MRVEILDKMRKNEMRRDEIYGKSFKQSIVCVSQSYVLVNRMC